MGEFIVPKGSLTFELGPTTDVPLQWATYYDAADQAGLSRLYGGIHIPADDFAGRKTGSVCGKAAWALASSYFDGTAPPRRTVAPGLHRARRTAFGWPVHVLSEHLGGNQ